MLTLVPCGPTQKLTPPEMVAAWVDPDRTVSPSDAISPRQDTQSSVKQQSGQQMVSSQDNAVAAALSSSSARFA